MWAVALIVIVDGIIRATPGSVYLYTEADCNQFGEMWEAEYVRQSGDDPVHVSHICTQLEKPGVDI